MVGFIDEREQPREYSDAVEGIAFGGKLGIWEGGVIAQDAEPRAHGENEGFEIGKVAIAGTTYVGRREEREHILGRFRKLPELCAKPR
jgi:hypothetical protein